MQKSSQKYIPADFENKWVKKWKRERLYQTTNDKRLKTKLYCLPMFPYPSGAGLHIGHVRIYTGCDVLARFFRMKGHPVLHPMGWDAFGLPAENAAIKAKKNPMDMVPDNIATFKRQMMSLGLSYDWSREFATSDPSYYQWTQWLFIQFFKMGLLYKQNTPINYCPFCKTGLAEEEVLGNDTHERCGKSITKKELPQWIFRITTYADRLLADLEGLDWPSGILDMQRNWIGKKEGITIIYKVIDPAIADPTSQQPQKVQAIPLSGSRYSSPPIIAEISCFTTRPDTNFGATFIVLAPEHEFVTALIDKKLKINNQKLQEIKDYVKQTQTKTEIERQAEGRKKTGIFTGFYAVNNLNGKLLPIWISDFVLPHVGTGAVVGVPGHDLRDFEFATTFDLPVIRVVVGKDGDTSEITRLEDVQEKEGTMVNSDFLNGMEIHAATKKIMDYLESKGWGKRSVTYHLRDWIFSRQRYWGEPIPMIYCQTCADKKINYWESNRIKNLKFKIKNSLYGWFPVPEDQLPVKLPYVKSYKPTKTGESPLSTIDSFVKTTCPHCGEEARRETDTMPNWAGSCWYFIRFAQNQNRIKNLGSQWLPVDWYLGGAEHAVLHLLYARFWVKALYDIGLISFQEPFVRLRNVGIVLAADQRKMSKSFGNVVNPDEVVEEFGADTLRLYEMFMAPFSSEVSWSKSAIYGCNRFLRRIWQIYNSSDYITKDKNVENKKVVSELQRCIAKVSHDIPNVKFNTAIAAMMEFLNCWESLRKLSSENTKKFLHLLAPFAPFISEEIWREVFHEKTSIHLSTWPTGEKTYKGDEYIIIPVQVNGKLRGIVEVSQKEVADEQTIVNKAIALEKVKKYVEGKKYTVRYVRGKILNVIL
ncbi:MAG TPA: leucine--tRNA ligase [Patescibacteria group bacterium]|nr:leucine--tRNA ligase [Patescibacteria group bacterium]